MCPEEFTYLSTKGKSSKEKDLPRTMLAPTEAPALVLLQP